jgi:predicted O-methyltransferase YrrM
LNASLLRCYVFHIHLPARSLGLAFRDWNRRVRVRLGLKKSRPDNCTLPSEPWHRLCRATGVQFLETNQADGNVNLAELAALNALCRTHNPKTILEIGTFDGRTTLNLALNSDAQVFTLDLPAATEAKLGTIGGDIKYVDKPAHAIGARFAQPPHNALPCAKRITQLYGDSATFDFSPWYGKVDFVFVDGAHNYDYVMNDTSVAKKLLRPEGGVIVWHDYGVWKDVTRALNELSKSDPSLKLSRIKNTSLVVAIVASSTPKS